MKIYNISKKIYGLGNDDFDYEAVYNSGYTAGYDSGYTDGLNDCPVDYAKIPLTFEVLSGGTIVWDCSNYEKTIQYKKNDGEWTSITSSEFGTEFNVDSGDIVMFKGNNDSYGISNNKLSSFSDTTAVFNVYGNIMSLLYDLDFEDKYSINSGFTFVSLFRYCNVVDAGNLILPATQLQDSCYRHMFIGCANLTTAPELPATTIAKYCYESMFLNCTSLTTAPELPATTLVDRCYPGMFNGCTSLRTAPELPATTLARGCYAGMFTNCHLINYVKCLGTNVSPTSNTNAWLEGVSETGTFVKNPNETWPTGNSGIPEGWTVVDAE